MPLDSLGARGVRGPYRVLDPHMPPTIDPESRFAGDPRFSQAIAAFESIGKADPRTIKLDGMDLPRQIGEARALLRLVLELEPSPSEALLLACHCQHLGRFKYPRTEFPPDRAGYKSWRVEAARRSSMEAAAILESLGCDSALIAQVVRIILKQERAKSADTQTMEDALCLAFLWLDADEFASRHSDDEMLRILKRSWLKMSEAGRARALELDLTPNVRRLIEKALVGEKD